MIVCWTVDDVCLEGYSSEAHLEALLEIFAQEGVRTTFFVVPRAEGRPLGERAGYVQILRAALVAGHAVAQHGLEHDRFELGIPPQMVLDLPHEGPARERLARERAVIEASLQVSAIRGRLAEGRRILEDALGAPVEGFRAPCLAICDNLFHALEAEGYLWDSSHHLQEAGWDLINGKTPIQPQPITRERFDKAQYPGRMRTFPLTTDYTWYLARPKFDDTFTLAQHDVRGCLSAGIPFVTVSHVSPIFQGDDDAGLELFRRVLDFARRQAAAIGDTLETITLTEACERFEWSVPCAHGH